MRGEGESRDRWSAERQRRRQQRAAALQAGVCLSRAQCYADLQTRRQQQFSRSLARTGSTLYFYLSLFENILSREFLVKFFSINVLLFCQLYCVMFFYFFFFSLVKRFEEKYEGNRTFEFSRIHFETEIENSSDSAVWNDDCQASYCKLSEFITCLNNRKFVLP